MLEITANTRVLVAIKPVDFRRGIDGLSQICRSVLASDPKDGTIFVFRCRNGKSIKLLAHDTQGFWLCQKRLSSGRFRHWPASTADTATAALLADEFLMLIWAGNRPLAYARAPALWQRVELPAAGAAASAASSRASTFASASV
jgi:transposase